MDALRAEQENAREAERRTSARNASNSKIGAGGSLELAGGIQVVENGDISVRDGGVVRVTSEIQDPQGVPYTIEAKLGNSQDPGYGVIPALVFRNDTLAENTFSSLSSIQGFDLSGRAEAGDYRAGFSINAEPGYTESNLYCSGGDIQPGYSVVRVTPGGFVLLANDADGNKIGNVRTNGPNAPMKIGGPKGLDVEGPLTNNGQPVGAAPAWADITGKPSSYPPAAHSHAIGDVTGLQQALTTYHAEFTATVPGNPGNPGVLSLDVDASSNAKDICTIINPGKIQILVAGYYSIDWFAFHNGTEAGAAAYMNIQSTHRTVRLSSIDIPSNSGSSALAIGSKYLPKDAILSFICNWGNSQPNLQSFITIHKKK